MLSWVDAASYTKRVWPGYEALIDLKALSWHYMNLRGMCSYRRNWLLSAVRC